MHAEAMVSRNRRISPGLAVRRSGDEISITTRNTGLRVLLALIVAGEVALCLCLWRAGVFADRYLSGIIWFAFLLLVPLALVAFYAVPGQMLRASRSGGVIEVQHRWLAVPIISRRIRAHECHRLSVVTLAEEEKTEEEISVKGIVIGLALGIDIVSYTHTWKAPVYAIQVKRRDGSWIISHLTWSADDCLRGVGLIWDVFPELQPKRLVDTVGESLVAGDRARVSLDREWASGAAGTVAEPPTTLAKFGAPWDGIRRFEGSGPGRLIFYWIEFDEPQEDLKGEGPHKAAEIDSRYLERA